jgi:hypothetical protein
MVANDFKSRRGVFARSYLFRTAFETSLRLRQIAFVKKLLLFFSEDKVFSALNAW